MDTRLHAGLTSTRVDPFSTQYLAGRYHAALQQRLSTDRDGGKPARNWLNPGEILQITTGIPAPESADTPPGELAHLSGDSTDWIRECVRRLRQSTAETDHRSQFTPLGEPSERVVGLLDSAVDTLRDIWPDAALELSTLVRVIVHLRSAEFNSATVVQAYGAVFVSEDWVSGPAHALEVLLHETGHHALYLRQAFVRLVTNPDELVSHPLRTDLRPVDGAVHAAQALGRIVLGLTRYRSTMADDGPHRHETDELLLTSHRQLEATVEVLDEHARWTSEGGAFRRSLHGVLAEARRDVERIFGVVH